MLGRQQIAGIPTAISELFKNAYDAYAHNVEVDFFRSDGLFVMRDDGVGMTREDFESRWLTLGTESKLKTAGGLAPPRIPEEETLRPILGEKGIGRLAIATIGDMLLVLTRPRYPTNEDEIVAAFIHWGMFALPGVNLDDLGIPIRTFAAADLPSREEVRSMTSSLASALESFSGRTDEEALRRVIAAVQTFDVDPAFLDHVLGEPSIHRGLSGTHFYVSPADAMMVAALDEGAASDRTSDLQRFLLGFTNTMTPGHPPPPIKTAFRDHRTDVDFVDILSEDEFFTPEEFLEVDHRITGDFDVYGQFRGRVSVFGEVVENHIVPFAAGGERLECGPFHIDFAVVQGADRQSTLPSIDWMRITQKMNRLGGLYIYNDGVRVLPYGNNDYDFLAIEKRRTLGAAYYFFSYRRMFGAIELTRENNGALQEKAGREGFRENRAYRELRDVLIAFFVQLAADFFRDESASSIWKDRQADLKRRNQAAQMRERRVRVKRTKFEDDLRTAMQAIEDDSAQASFGATLDAARNRFELVKTLRNAADVERGLIDAEVSARADVSQLRNRYHVVAPRGIGLSKNLRREYESYLAMHDRFLEATVEPANLEIERLAETTAQAVEANVDRRLRFYGALEELGQTSRSITSKISRETTELATKLETRIGELTLMASQAVDKTVREVMSAAHGLDISGLDDADFVKERSKLERTLESVVDGQRQVLATVADQIRAVRWEFGEDGRLIIEGDFTEALEDELFALRERTDIDLDLAQLGMSVQIINHEFEASIRAVRSTIRELRRWADANEALRPVYDGIRTSFDHLDGYLSLFTPLQRRLYRKAVAVRGTDISKYIEDLFAERLRRHHVKLTTTPTFRSHQIIAYPSTIFPVVVNLIDNALFWLDSRTEDRQILFSLRGKDILISNNGPWISEADAEAIFEMGFTRRPAGRGLGLAIARSALRRDGFDIVLTTPPEGMSVSFVLMEPAEE